MSDVPIDLRRRSDSRLLVSRVAADLFWRHGIAATRGDDIAAACGISTRTLWRYFRSKEACVEPVLEALGTRFVAVLRAWPATLSIEDYLRGSARPGPVVYSADDVAAMRMIVLGESEPALRSSWLMVCDAAERASTPLLAQRLGLASENERMRRIAASVSGAVRALNDELAADFVRSAIAPPSEDVIRALAAAMRESSGGALGPAASTPP